MVLKQDSFKKLKLWKLWKIRESDICNADADANADADMPMP